MEVILDEGVLSGIISEVARGVSAAPPSSATGAPEPRDPMVERLQRNAFSTQQTQKLQEQKSSLMSAIGKEAYNGVDLFEGTTPAPSEASPTQMASGMASQAPGNSGVDIGRLFGSVGSSWNAHMNNVEKGK